MIEGGRNTQVGPKILIPYILGDEPDWENHYNYLKSFFDDPRYVRLNDKPVFVIYNYTPEIGRMANYWNELALKDGFSGICVVYRYKEIGRFRMLPIIPSSEYQYNYEPVYNGWQRTTLVTRIMNKITNIRRNGKRNKLRKLDYDIVWKNILENAEKEFTRKNFFHGGFVSYDDTPRRGNKGTIIEGGSPEKFKKYLNELMQISEKQNKEFIFLTAWNEWGEGAYLEPDTINKYAYLEVIKELTK